MTFDRLQEGAEARQLTILGGFHPGPEDQLPDNCQTLLLLGPDEPHFWPAFTQSPEWMDRHPDPVDRWSRRVIGTWADELDATPLYPFGGPPYQPFYSWALRTGRIHVSPVQFLVHDQAGLFVSFRGALALPQRVDLPATGQSPCARCETQPCRTACLSGALSSEGYDVPACQAFLKTDAGAQNMARGCAVRRSCPVSQKFGRLEVQSAYHMDQFRKG